MRWLASLKESPVIQDAAIADISACVRLFVSQKDLSYTTFKQCWSTTHLSYLHLCRSEKIDIHQYNSCLFASTLTLLSCVENASFPADVVLHSNRTTICSLVWKIGVLYTLYTMYATANICTPIRVSIESYTILRLITSQLEVLSPCYSHQWKRIWATLHNDQAIRIGPYDGATGLHRLASIYLGASTTLLPLLHETRKHTEQLLTNAAEINVTMEELGYKNTDPIITVSRENVVFSPSEATTSTGDILSFFGESEESQPAHAEYLESDNGMTLLQQLEQHIESVIKPNDALETVGDMQMPQTVHASEHGMSLLELLEKQVGDVMHEYSSAQTRKTASRELTAESIVAECALSRLEQATALVMQKKRTQRHTYKAKSSKAGANTPASTKASPRPPRVPRTRKTTSRAENSVVDIAALLDNLESSTAEILRK